MNLPTKFKEVYEEYYQLHPGAMTEPKLHYLHRQWIFPNHIDVMLDLVEDFGGQFFPEANLDIALFAALLHDAGLVYKRTDASPAGHEERSVEYATMILRKYEFDQVFIDQVCLAIRATDPEVMPETDEAHIVRNADAYSHLSSMHFFAKAYFADDLPWYIDWFDKKIHTSIDKLTVPGLAQEKKPVVEQYEKMLDLYRKHQNKRFIDL